MDRIARVVYPQYAFGKPGPVGDKMLSKMKKTTYNDYRKYTVLPPNSKYSEWTFAIPKRNNNNHSNILTLRTGGINEEADDSTNFFFILLKI